MRETITAITTQLANLSNIARNTDLTGDQIERLYNLKTEIQSKVFQYERLYNLYIGE